MANEKLDLVLERVVDVPPEAVWKAWTEPERLKRWFCPVPWKTVACEIDLKPGGKFSTIFEGPGGQRMDNGEGCYLEVVPNRKLVWTGALRSAYRPNPPPSGQFAFAFTCILTLTPEGKGTRYRAELLHADEAGRNAHASMGFHDGWGKALDQLVAMVEAG